MTDNTLDLSQSLDTVRKLLKIIDNGDSTFAISVVDMNVSPLSTTGFDTILITYSDATKATISKIEWKLGGVVVKTHTPTFATLTDTWVRS